MNTFLADILAKRRAQLEREMSLVPLKEIRAVAERAGSCEGSFKKALLKKGLSVIAEVKKASPSKGVISEVFDPAAIARAYEEAGADAVSCLTEESYFMGSLDCLRQVRAAVGIPVLRKDFIIDSYQLYEARAAGADAVLLIAAVLDDGRLKEYNKIARSIGLDVLAEAHDREEVMRLADIGFDIIGVNNRDLKTFEVSLENTRRLREYVPKECAFVCESGIRTAADMHYALDSGADAVLIGETLMRSGLCGVSACMKGLREGTYA